MYSKHIPIKRTNSYAHMVRGTEVSAEKLKFSPATYGFKITMFKCYRRGSGEIRDDFVNFGGKNGFYVFSKNGHFLIAQ